MPRSLYAVHGVTCLVVCVGEEGRIIHHEGPRYEPREVASPTTATLRAVWVESTTSAWAVGDGVALHWDGASWRSLPMMPTERLCAVWAHPATGAWVAGRGVLYHFGADGSGPTLFTSDVGAVAIWGTGPNDISFLVDGRAVMRWSWAGCDAEALPDDDGEWTALAGSAEDEPVYIVGPSEFCMERTKLGWFELSTYTTDRLTGACSRWANDLWVTTDGGRVRHWNGFDWRVVAFSAFGPLYGICCVDEVIWAVGAGGAVIQHLPDDGGAKE